MKESFDQHAGAGVIDERDAEPLAIGRRDEGELRPAGGAQPGIADRLAAGGAELRQRHIDREAANRPQRTADAAQPRGPLLRGDPGLHPGFHGGTLARPLSALNGM